MQRRMGRSQRSKKRSKKVVNEEGRLVEVRSVRRILVEERWGAEVKKWVKVTPWNRYKGDAEADGEVPEVEEVAEGGG